MNECDKMFSKIVVFVSSFLILSLGRQCKEQNLILYRDHQYTSNNICPTIHHSFTHIDNFLILFGGYYADMSISTQLAVYDLSANAWLGFDFRRGDGSFLKDYRLSLNELRLESNGELPIPRAEHGASSVSGILYVFGGLSSIGYMNDVISFSPKTFTWKNLNNAKSSHPTGRAGHSMIQHDNQLVIFGGRTEIGGVLRSLNDVWIFDPNINIWTELKSNPLSSAAPTGREYCSSYILHDRLWVFGGLDGATNQVFSDLWVFHLKSHIWYHLQSNNNAYSTFTPPPLYYAHFIPVLQPQPSASTKFSLLIYGGVGSGGYCGDFSLHIASQPATCRPAFTNFGQLYQLDIELQLYPSSRLLFGVGGNESDYISRVTWRDDRSVIVPAAMFQEYDPMTQDGKLYAFEALALSSLDPSVAYEYGGVSALTERQRQRLSHRPTAATAPLSAGGSYLDELENDRNQIESPATEPWNLSRLLFVGPPRSNQGSFGPIEVESDASGSGFTTTLEFQGNVRTWKATDKTLISI